MLVRTEDLADFVKLAAKVLDKNPSVETYRKIHLCAKDNSLVLEAFDGRVGIRGRLDAIDVGAGFTVTADTAPLLVAASKISSPEVEIGIVEDSLIIGSGDVGVTLPYQLSEARTDDSLKEYTETPFDGSDFCTGLTVATKVTSFKKANQDFAGVYLHDDNMLATDSHRFTRIRVRREGDETGGFKSTLLSVEAAKKLGRVTDATAVLQKKDVICVVSAVAEVFALTDDAAKFPADAFPQFLSPKPVRFPKEMQRAAETALKLDKNKEVQVAATDGQIFFSSGDKDFATYDAHHDWEYDDFYFRIAAQYLKDGMLISLDADISEIQNNILRFSSDNIDHVVGLVV